MPFTNFFSVFFRLILCPVIHIVYCRLISVDDEYDILLPKKKVKLAQNILLNLTHNGKQRMQTKSLHETNIVMTMVINYTIN